MVASFPGLLHSRPSVCVQYNTIHRSGREEKTGKDAYHVNDVRWMYVGGEGSTFK